MTAEITGKTSAELRAAFLAARLVPTAERVFATSPEVHSVVYAVAQFWADEADDAVHEIMVPCVDVDPKWPACLGAPIFDEDGGLSKAFHERWDEAGLSAYGYFHAPEGVPSWDDNGLAITAFASCCLEDCDQETPTGEAYTPYAIARRDPKDASKVAIEIVGRLVRPEWEDRFDVGFRE